MEFNVQLNEKISEIENIIDIYMPKEFSLQKTVIDAMHYTISAGGKRIRPLLMYEVYKLYNGKEDIIKPFMAAIEMIHTYSLIHDDLPALDNDDYRRGKKTAHIVYGEAMAILAGDSLLNYAFETAARSFSMLSFEGETTNYDICLKELKIRKNLEKAMQVLTHKPGIYGMIGGQVADVGLTGTKINEEQLDYIYKNKTSALIEASMMIGAILADVTDSEIEKIEKVAYNIGIAFQIQDDILDETATFEELGKPIHSDEKNEKVTYVTLYGLKEAEEKVKNLSNEAISILKQINGDSRFLIDLVNALIYRKK